MEKEGIEYKAYRSGWDNGYNQGYTDASTGSCQRIPEKTMKTSEKLRTVLCDPDGKISITGSAEDIKTAQEALEEVKLLEKYLESLKQIMHCRNQVGINIQAVKDEEVRKQILFAWNVFSDFPNN